MQNNNVVMSIARTLETAPAVLQPAIEKFIEQTEASPEDVAIAVGLEKGSELVQQINEILAGLSDEERQQMMDEAVARQPVSE